MSKKKGWLMSIETFRTPEQHRALIQPHVEAVGLVVQSPKRSRKVRLSKAGNGTASLSARMLAMGLRTYSQYLATAHWLDVKTRWKASNMFKGWVCHTYGCDSSVGLSLHHWTYERVGREELSDLILVCAECHKRIHRLERRGMPLDAATRTVTKHLPVNA